MICQSCGRANELGAKFCKSCGAPLESNETVQQNNAYQPNAPYQPNNGYQSNNGYPSNNGYQQGNQYGMPESMYSGTTRMTKKEFDECANIKILTKNITAAAVIAYVIGAITFIVNVIMAGNIAGILDVLIVVGLGLGIHLAKSRVCAVIITAYSIFNLIYMLLLTGAPGGWLIIVCGVYSIIYTFKYQKAWNKYQQTGQI